MHATWLVSQGQIPFRDFGEHHAPALWFTFAPLATLPLSKFLFFSRLVIFASVLISTFLVYWLGKKYFSELAGLLAAFFVSVDLSIVIRTSEFRPDPLMAFFSLSALAVLLCAKSKKKMGPVVPEYTAALIAGLLFGISFAFKQTAIFPFAGACFALLLVNFFHKRLELKSILFESVTLTAGFLLPFLMTFSYFYLSGGISDYINGVYLMNADYARTSLVDRLSTLKTSHINDAFFWLAFYLAIISISYATVKQGLKQVTEAELFISISSLAVFASFFVSAVCYWQYIIPLVLVGSILAASRIVSIVNKINGTPAMAILLLIFTVSAVFIPALRILEQDLPATNREQLRVASQVLSLTNSSEKIFDAQAYYVQRQHAHPIWFMGLLLPGKNLEDVPQVLERENVRYVIQSTFLMNRSSGAVNEYIANNYVSVETGSPCGKNLVVNYQFYEVRNTTLGKLQLAFNRFIVPFELCVRANIS